MKGLTIAVVVLLLSEGARADPNIVYIISDDQTWTDFGFMGNDRVYTPNIDSLAENSVVFENGYLTTSVCRPSLVTLLTGLYPHQHGIYFNHGPPGNSGYNRMSSVEEYVEAREKEFELIRRVETLPGMLAEKGYRSLQTGKFWEGHWRNGGFTEGMTTFTAPSPEQTYGGIRKLASGERVAHGNGDHGLRIGRETMEPVWDFISECEKEETPWLLWYAPYLPHQPHDSPEQFYDIAESTPGIQRHEVPYYASIAQFDETVGTLIDFVEENSDPENTLFVFVCDNGWSPGKEPQKGREQEFAHTRTSKRAPFDEGVRSPILIRWDGVIEPQRRRELVSSIDIVPTLLGAAEIDPSRSMSGVDLIKGLKQDNLDPDRAVFGAIYPGDASRLRVPEADVAYRWVRKGAYKLIVPRGKDAWGDYVKTDVLFDVAADPNEKRDLIGASELSETREELRNSLDEWWDPDANLGKKVAMQMVSLCAAAKEAGIDFVAEAGYDEVRTMELIAEGRTVKNEDSPFDGTYFGLPQFKEIDLLVAEDYVEIESHRLQYCGDPDESILPQVSGCVGEGKQ